MFSSVSAENDIAEFLKSRRARVTPEQVGSRRMARGG
jgi:hypothetical protein